MASCPGVSVFLAAVWAAVVGDGFLRLFGAAVVGGGGSGPVPECRGAGASIELDVGDGRLVAYGLTGEYVIIDLTKIQ